MKRSGGIKTSKYWFARAEECRALALSFHTEAVRQKMLEVADNYRRMALRAAEQELAASVSRTTRVGADAD